MAAQTTEGITPLELQPAICYPQSVADGQSIPGGFTGISIGVLAGMVLLFSVSQAIHGLSITGVAIGTFMGALAGVALLLLLSPAIMLAPRPIATPKPIAAISKLIMQLTSAILSLPNVWRQLDEPLESVSKPLASVG